MINIEEKKTWEIESALNRVCKRYTQALNTLKRITNEDSLLRKYAEMNALDSVLQMLLKEYSNRRTNKYLVLFQKRYDALLVKRYGQED
jgi:hypothetical protein